MCAPGVALHTPTSCRGAAFDTRALHACILLCVAAGWLLLWDGFGRGSRLVAGVAEASTSNVVGVSTEDASMVPAALPITNPRTPFVVAVPPSGGAPTFAVALNTSSPLAFFTCVEHAPSDQHTTDLLVGGVTSGQTDTLLHTAGHKMVLIDESQGGTFVVPFMAGVSTGITHVLLWCVVLWCVVVCCVVVCTAQWGVCQPLQSTHVHGYLTLRV